MDNDGNTLQRVIAQRCIDYDFQTLVEKQRDNKVIYLMRQLQGAMTLPVKSRDVLKAHAWWDRLLVDCLNEAGLQTV